MSLLGAALLRSGRYALAAPLITQGYAGLKTWQGRMSRQDLRIVRGAAEWATQLYQNSSVCEHATDRDATFVAPCLPDQVFAPLYPPR
jgi:hypothetical protein